MNTSRKYTRTPVRRQSAEHYLLLTLLSFAGSVSLTRLFLELTGYPQLGGGGLHIAHMLWGGLLLFVAALLMLLFSNRWVFQVGALLAGMGVGLFIDEVGKFITQTNDYFYPPAAPIIYTFFLLVVLLYLQVRRMPPRSPRSELYRVFDALGELLDHDLDADERAEIEARLHYVLEYSRNPEQIRLAKDLLEFIRYEDLPVAPRLPGPLEHLKAQLASAEARLVNQGRLRTVLAVGLGALGVVAFYNLLLLLMSQVVPGPFERTLNALVAAGRLASRGEFNLFLTRLGLDGSSGLLLCVAAVLLALRRDRQGTMLGFFTLLFSLTIVDLLVFYYDQFSTIILALIQLLLLLGVLYYRQQFLPPESGLPEKDGGSPAAGEMKG